MTVESTVNGQSETATSVLDRTFRLLSAFTLDHSELTLGELVARTGIPRTTVYRLARELLARRLLEHGNGRYRLGPELFELGERVPRLRTLRQRMRPYLRALRERADCTVALGVLDGAEVLYLLDSTSTGSSVSPLRDGQRIPAHCTAMGKVLLAHSDDAVVEEILDTGLPRYTRYTIVEPGRLHSELLRIRRQGYATEYEEFRHGHAGIAAAVFGPQGQVVAAVAVEDELVRGDPGRFAPMLRAAANRASIRRSGPTINHHTIE